MKENTELSAYFQQVQKGSKPQQIVIDAYLFDFSIDYQLRAQCSPISSRPK